VEPVRTAGRKHRKSSSVNKVTFDGLSSNTEYKVSVQGIAPEDPRTGTSFAHVRTKRPQVQAPPKAWVINESPLPENGTH